MVEFEQPKRKALSDAELHRAVTLLGSSAEGLVASERLIAEQAILRQQDSDALAAWIKQLQSDGSPRALATLQRFAQSALPTISTAAQSVSEPHPPVEDKALFTSELQRIDRRMRSRRSEVMRKVIPSLASWLTIALVNLLISTWLELSSIESVLSITIGLMLSALFLPTLKSHSLHPLLRSAAVFGGWGVYVGAGLAMALSALILLEGALHVSDLDLLQPLITYYRSDLLIAALAAVFFSQILPRSSFHWVLLVSTLAIVANHLLAPQPIQQISWFAYAPESGAVFIPTADLSVHWSEVFWGACAVGFVAVMLFAFGMPHIPTRAWSFTLQIPLGIGLSCALVFTVLSDLTAILILGLCFFSIAFSGRDLSGKSLGRFAGLAFLIPVLFFPLLDWLNGPSVAVLVALIVVLFGDQLVRRTPLHIPSLDTSYGFYGSFQLVTWLGLAIAAPFGILQVQEILLPQTTFTQHELALVFGLVIGSLTALARVFTIKNQDREIRNVEIRNMNLDNLLGL